MSIDPRMGRTLLVAFVAFGLVGALLLDRPRFMPIDLAWHGEPCLGVGLDATLHGAQADSQLTWAVIARAVSGSISSGRLDTRPGSRPRWCSSMTMASSSVTRATS
jgi:hypothetical protein